MKIPGLPGSEPNRTLGISRSAPAEILEAAGAALRSRGVEYDGKGYEGGERSMQQTVEIFRAITGISLSVVDGWRFMIALKLARSTTGKPKLDTYIDLAGYSALAGEAHLTDFSSCFQGGINENQLPR